MKGSVTRRLTLALSPISFWRSPTVKEDMAVGFDVSVEQLLAPLSASACVVARGSEVPTPLTGAAGGGAGAHRRHAPRRTGTSSWRTRPRWNSSPRTVRLLIAGGEAMSPAAAREWASGPALPPADTTPTGPFTATLVFAP
jgi:hypothetical protein